MRNRIPGIAALLIALAVPSLGRAVCESGPVVSEFEVDLESWTAVSATSFSRAATGGNPDGHAVVDNSETALAAIIAPAKFRGDLRPCGGGIFSFDGRMLGTGGSGYSNPNFDYGSLRISGGAGSMVVDLLPGSSPGNAPPTDVWARYSVPFTAATFGQTQTQFDAILANVTEVRLGVEALFGAEIQGIDNFRLAPPTPVPALPIAGRIGLGLALLALGSGLARRSISLRLDPSPPDSPGVDGQG